MSYERMRVMPKVAGRPAWLAFVDPQDRSIASRSFTPRGINMIPSWKRGRESIYARGTLARQAEIARGRNA